MLLFILVRFKRGTLRTEEKQYIKLYECIFREMKLKVSLITKK